LVETGFERNWKGTNPKDLIRTRERDQGRAFAVCMDAHQLILQEEETGVYRYSNVFILSFFFQMYSGI